MTALTAAQPTPLATLAPCHGAGRSRCGSAPAALPARLHTALVLPPGVSTTLAARQPMLLVVERGRAWVTLGDARLGPRQEAAGDVVLVPGACLAVAAGHSAVLESLDAGQTLQVRWLPA